LKTGFLNGAAIAVAILLLAVGGPWLVRELRTLPSHHQLAARSNERIVTLEISGMTCSGCAAKVKGSLATVPGVSAAEVRLHQDRAIVVCARSVPDSALIGAVESAGPSFLAAIATRE
jgi:copper chaperone CopZ